MLYLRSINRFILISLAFLGLSVSPANAALLNSYDFTNDLSDTLGNGNDLVASGGTVGGGRYSFGLNQGLRLTSALPSTTDYGIEVRFLGSDSFNGYNKVFDFQDLTSDHGLYVLNSSVSFYTAAGAAGSVSLNSDFTLGLERTGTTLNGFIDGVSIFSVSDLGGQAVSALNILNFFEDDNATGQREAFMGSADFIRIHNDSSTFTAPSAVPVPAAVWLFGTALIGLVGFGRRKKAA